jgi:hypothetical protein
MSKPLLITIVLAGTLVGAALLLVLANVGTAWQASERLQAKVADLTAAGEPVTFSDLARGETLPADNALAPLIERQAAIEAIDKQLGSLNEDDSLAFDEGRLTPGVQALLDKVLTEHGETLAAIERAATCPKFDPAPPLDEGVDAFEAQVDGCLELSRQAIRVLNARTLWLLANDRADEAAQTTLVMFRLADLVDQGETVVCFLCAIAGRTQAVRRAEQALRTAKVSPRTRSALTSYLDTCDNAAAFRRALAVDRVEGYERCLEAYEQYCAGRINLVFLESSVLNQARQLLEFYDEPLKWGRRRYAGVASATEITNPPEGLLLSVWLPPLKPIMDALSRNRALVRCLTVLSAVQKRGDDGAEQLNVEELGLPNDVVTDPFNGGKLQLNKLPGGWLVYSVGANLQDDGGRLAEFVDVGVGPDEAWAEPAAVEP